MQSPSVLIAANPYEGELCRRALAPTGLQVIVAEGGEGVHELLERERPLAMIIALGLFGVDGSALLSEVRAAEPGLPIFLLADREHELGEPAAALRAGATRLFVRPFDIDALADAIEKRAVEAEGELELPIDAATRTAPVLELEADYEPTRPPAPSPVASRPVVAVPATPVTAVEAMAAPATPAAPLRPSATEVLAEAAPSRLVERERTNKLFPAALEPAMAASGAAAAGNGVPAAPVPSGGSAPTALLRADDALAAAAGLGFDALAIAPELVVRAAEPEASAAPLARPATTTPVVATPPRRPREAARSPVARRLEDEVSAAAERLFPGEPAGDGDDERFYEDALGDIDLEALGIEGAPWDTPAASAAWETGLLGADGLDAHRGLDDVRGDDLRGGDGDDAPTQVNLQARRPRNGHAATPPLTPIMPDEEGALDALDVATLIGRLHGAGFTGRLALRRAEGEKALYFDAGLLVSAASSFAHDRVAELVAREGKLSREQRARARALNGSGRIAVQQLVAQGWLKPSEIYPTLRRWVEELAYSMFAWSSGSYALGPEQPAAEERVRLATHPWALVIEGVRRKYGLERLLELVGPLDTVVAPTAWLGRALAEAELSPAERAHAERLDGARSLGEIARALGATPLGEGPLLGLAWGLCAIGAARVGPAGADAAMPPWPAYTPSTPGERRARARDGGPADEAREQAIERERVRAKLEQLDDADYFALLGLDRDASSHEVERAYQHLSHEFAAARFAAPLRLELADALGEIAVVLTEARAVLADDALRARYRSHLPDA